ncbi:ATP-binding protein [Streptomyces heliomycini]
MSSALVRTALAEREHAADCDYAELLTAELVANAVEHTSGGAPIELVVRLLPTGCQSRCTTPTRSRPATSPARPRRARPLQEHGRGCAAADPHAELVLRSPPHESGKAVWFRLPGQRRPV